LVAFEERCMNLRVRRTCAEIISILSLQESSHLNKPWTEVHGRVHCDPDAKKANEQAIKKKT
jgi:hypothetical protein